MTRRFCLLLVKPSHYDHDGYVIQWYRSAIPSNSLAALYGLARENTTPASTAPLPRTEPAIIRSLAKPYSFVEPEITSERRVA
jgi:hypothetical protein